MKFLPSLTGTLSGSIGGLTASRNRGGGYFRRKVVPVNTTSDQRTLIRGIFSTLTNYWTNTLDAGERASWTAYGDAVTVTDVLGQSKKLTGLQWFIALNTPRLQKVAIGETADAVLDVAPASNSIGPGIDALTVGLITADTQLLLASIVSGAGIVSGDQAFLYVSRPQNPSINFFKGPFRLAGITAAVGAGTITTTALALPFPVVTGQKVFVRAVIVKADGRVGPEFIGEQIVIATDPS